jgi:hypothetical protein
MSAPKIARPSFQSVELDPIDIRLEAKAAERGIPTLVAPRPETTLADEPAPPVETATLAPRKPPRQNSKQATPRSRMKGLRIELPDYAWIALKKLAAEQMVSLRHVIMTALRAQGITINDADMIEDGRRHRE